MSSLAITNFSLLEKVAFERFGYAGVEKVKSWENLLHQASLETDMVKVSLVNNYVNRLVKYSADDDNYSVEDYWATPMDALLGGAGDCEDYAISKYVLLKQLNLKDQNLRIQYVLHHDANGENISHMVLLYYPNPSEDPLVLDNLTNKIVLAPSRSDLSPIYSFNATGYWASNVSVTLGNPVKKISKWRDLLMRMKNEGIQLD